MLSGEYKSKHLFAFQRVHCVWFFPSYLNHYLILRKTRSQSVGTASVEDGFSEKKGLGGVLSLAGS